jgi:hypothetical protein
VSADECQRYKDYSSPRRWTASACRKHITYFRASAHVSAPGYPQRYPVLVLRVAFRMADCHSPSRGNPLLTVALPVVAREENHVAIKKVSPGRLRAIPSENAKSSGMRAIPPSPQVDRFCPRALGF